MNIVSKLLPRQIELKCVSRPRVPREKNDRGLLIIEDLLRVLFVEWDLGGLGCLLRPIVELALLDGSSVGIRRLIEDAGDGDAWGGDAVLAGAVLIGGVEELVLVRDELVVDGLCEGLPEAALRGSEVAHGNV